MRRAQPSQLPAVKRSAVVPALVLTLNDIVASSSRGSAPIEPPSGALYSISESSQDVSVPPPRPAASKLAEPKLVAVGLSAIANLLFIGGHDLVFRAAALPLLVRLLDFSDESEVQSYALAALQNLSASSAYGPFLLSEPKLLGSLRELAVLLPDGDARFYYAAGALTNLVKLAMTSSGAVSASSSWLGVCGGGGNDTAIALLALRAADAEMTNIIARRAQLKLNKAAVKAQAAARARIWRKRFLRARVAASLIQAAARRASDRRAAKREHEAAIRIQRAAVALILRRSLRDDRPILLPFRTGAQLNFFSPVRRASTMPIVFHDLRSIATPGSRESNAPAKASGGRSPAPTANPALARTFAVRIPKTPGSDANKDGRGKRPPGRRLRPALIALSGQDENIKFDDVIFSNKQAAGEAQTQALLARRVLPSLR